MSSQTEMERAAPQCCIFLSVFQRQLDTKLIHLRGALLSPSPPRDTS